MRRRRCKHCGQLVSSPYHAQSAEAYAQVSCPDEQDEVTYHACPSCGIGTSQDDGQFPTECEGCTSA